jgi:DNA-binding IclR family transcriptional regulator
VLDGTSALVVERLAGSRTQPTRHSPGGRLPLHCTAVGKVLLAHAPAELLTRVEADLRRFTPWTTTDPDRLRRQLQLIRGSGLGRSAQEHRPGVSSLAMPVTGATGVVASLGILAPLTTPRLGGAVGPLSAAAAAVGAAVTAAALEQRD